MSRQANSAHGRRSLMSTVASTALTLSLAVGLSASASAQQQSSEPPSGSQAAAVATPNGPNPAAVASEQPAALSNADVEEIIVTGTLIRGIAPAGANVIGVNDKAVQESGATSTAQLLQTIPQLGTFNNLQVPTGASTAVTTNRPNLRNLPGFNTSGASPTLVLVDGHRVVGAGISVTSPDPDIVPPEAIERVEIVPDGGSAIYGSDAVAGVINFITKKHYDGLDIGGHFGLTDGHYRSFDANVSTGHKWSTGSAYITYNYAQHNELRGRNLDYVFQPNTTIDGITATSFKCPQGNVTVGNLFLPTGTPTTTYGLNADGTRKAAGVVNQCDDSDYVTIYPREHRHSALAGLTQELSDKLTFDVRAFYTYREDFSNAGPAILSTSFGPSFLASFGFLSSPLFNANKVSTGFLASGETQTVYYQFGGPDAGATTTKLATYGIAPTFTYRINDNFQLRSISSYSESITNYRQKTYDQTSLNNGIIAGLFNPYAPSLSNSTVLAAEQNFELYGRTRQEQFDTRLIVDGELFHLPGGGAKIALGAEYESDSFDAKNGTSVIGTEDSGYGGLIVNGSTIVTPEKPLRDAILRRNVKSVFGELAVPIFGKENARPGLEELTLSAAGRFDHYSDFGNTTNPKFGITYRPLTWVKLRGAYGKSFVAPSLADDPRESVTSVTFINLALLLPPTGLVGTTVNGVVVPAINGRSQAIVLGNEPGIQPQHAKTISAGFDLDPPFLRGLHLSATYFNIKYNGVISIPNFTSASFYPNYIGTGAITFNPTQAQIDAVTGVATTINGSSCGGNTAAAQTGCYVLIDARKQNLANYKLDGLDFGVNYFRPTGFGSVDFAFNGNYELDRKQQATQNLPYISQIDANASRFKFRSSIGAQIGGLRAEATLNHSAGYRLDPPVGVGVTQTRVGAYDTVDLFFKYDLKGEGLMHGLSLTLNVNNLLNQDPPIYRLQSLTPQADGYINGGTIGRYIQFGFNKRF